MKWASLCAVIKWCHLNWIRRHLEEIYVIWTWPVPSRLNSNSAKERMREESFDQDCDIPGDPSGKYTMVNSDCVCVKEGKSSLWVFYCFDFMCGVQLHWGTEMSIRLLQTDCCSQSDFLSTKSQQITKPAAFTARGHEIMQCPIKPEGSSVVAASALLLNAHLGTLSHKELMEEQLFSCLQVSILRQIFALCQ